MSSRQFVWHLFLLRHPESEVSWHQSVLTLRLIWWLEHISRSYNIFRWPGKVMSCLAHLAVGPIVTTSLLARLTILPWRNCKTYSISCFRWILCIQSLIFTWRPCQCYLEACLWYSDFPQEHLTPNAKCFLLNYPNTVVWVMSGNFSPHT